MEGGPTSSHATAGIALNFFRAHKSPFLHRQCFDKMMSPINLCVDMIIRYDILKWQSRVHLHFGGSKLPICICALALPRMPSPSLFANLTSDGRPVAKSLIGILKQKISKTAPLRTYN